MKTVTLYTGRSGYLLFQIGQSFLASVERVGSDDYTVVAPVECIKDYQTDDDYECYDVVEMDGVTVERDE